MITVRYYLIDRNTDIVPNEDQFKTIYKDSRDKIKIGNCLGIMIPNECEWIVPGTIDNGY